MTKEILIQYADVHQEVKDLRKRIEETEKRLLALKRGGTVIDSVRGTRRDGTIGSIRIEGFPMAEYSKREDSLKRYIQLLTEKETDLLDLLTQSEEFIETIPDSHLRMIIRYRVVDDLTWRQVAQRIGGGNTEDGVRMAFNRYFEEKE